MRHSSMLRLIGAVCLLAVAGCSSTPQDKVYEAFKCGKVATLLEQADEGKAAMRSAIPYIKQMDDAGNPARMAMELNQKFQDDVPLYQMDVDSQMSLLASIYQSDECQALYVSASEATTALAAPSARQHGEHERSASDQAVVGNAIASFAASKTGKEYRDARRVAVGDLDGDGAGDLAVLYTVEVGSRNTSTQYLAAFLRQKNGSLKLTDVGPVGGQGNAIDGIAIQEGWLKLHALTPGPDDADCCPMVPGEVDYLLRSGKLRRVEN